MAYGQNQRNELVRLQSEVSNEISRDAPHIARMVFGDAKDHPDVVGVPNERLDEVYRQKFQSEDRAWLQAEARRDPEQFLKVAERIGARIPPPQPPAPAQPSMPMPAPVVAPVAPPAPLPMPALLPQVSMAPMPAPTAVPALPATVVPQPVIYGPNGQPLT